MIRVYYLVICVSAFVTGWGLSSGNVKATLIGMVVALSCWIVTDEDF